MREGKEDQHMILATESTTALTMIISMVVTTYYMTCMDVKPRHQNLWRSTMQGALTARTCRTKTIVLVHRVSFWRGVLRDYLLRRRWMLKFLRMKRKSNF